MLYGSLEYAFAQPFAEALVHASDFRAWVIRQTKFAASADTARLLHEEMWAHRSRGAATWWRSHFTERCRCEGCRGQETDVLAVFEAQCGARFALHVEVKGPTDRFPARRDQAANYGLRASCWAKSAPKAVLPHGDAATMLLCSASKLAEYAAHLPNFGSVITFEAIAARWPDATAPGVMSLRDASIP
ncbi:hypothetical protein ASF08_21715 [Methylobacterium sp. Leaf85]|nr:hypothetical protein ASF08_21715 [Methylobacterium sp. Leaf85]